MKIYLILMIVTSALAICKYGICDNSLKDKKCLDKSSNPVRIKKCLTGQICIQGTCVDIPTNIKKDVGEESTDPSECYSGKVSGGYCQGKLKYEACDSTLSNMCDGGLFCSKKRMCENVAKEGESCKSKACAANLLCYPDTTCKPYYSLATGEKSCFDNFCNTGIVHEGRCSNYLSLKSDQWINDSVSEIDACIYEDNKKFSASCVCYTSDKESSGHCRLKTEAAMGISTIRAYLDKFQASYCPPGNPTCAKAWRNIGACTYQRAMKAIYYNYLIEEQKYPFCLDKYCTNLIDSIPCQETLLCGQCCSSQDLLTQ